MLTHIKSIHATSDILATLSNIRSVMQPGGKLVLLENTRCEYYLQPQTRIIAF